MSINTLTLEGNLVADCEVIDLDGDPNIIRFTIAHNERRYNKETREYEDADPTYVECSIYDSSGKRTAWLQDDLVKGAHAVVEGRVHQDRWEKDGQNYSKVVCRVNDVVVRPARGKSDSKPGRSQRRQRVDDAVKATNPLPPAQIDGADAYDMDIPFGG